MSDQPSQPIELRGRFGRIAAWAVFCAAIMGGVALFSANILSIKENVLKLFAEKPASPLEVIARDVRGTGVQLEESHALVFVEAVLEKKGVGKTECEAGLLMKNVEYRPRNFVSGVGRRTVGPYYDEGWWFGDSHKTNLPESFRQGVVQFHFAVEKMHLESKAKFRVDCSEWVTPWVAIEFPEQQSKQ